MNSTLESVSPFAMFYSYSLSALVQISSLILGVLFCPEQNCVGTLDLISADNHYQNICISLFLFFEDSLYLTKRFADYSQHLSTSKECCAGMLALQFSDILCIPQRNSPVNIRGNPMSLWRSVYWSNIIVQEDDLTSNSHN